MMWGGRHETQYDAPIIIANFCFRVCFVLQIGLHLLTMREGRVGRGRMGIATTDPFHMLRVILSTSINVRFAHHSGELRVINYR